MKDYDLDKLNEIKDFDYDQAWNEDEKENVKKAVKELPIGEPRKGIRGRYIKKKGNVTKRQIKNSYSKFLKDVDK